MSLLGEDEADLREFNSTASRDAFNRIATRYLNFVYGVARRQGGTDAHAAEDVTQAVFLILARRAGSIRAATLSNWLFTTTRHVAANARKLAARRRHHEHRAAAQNHEDDMRARRNDSRDHEELSDHLTAALATQRESDRAIVLMRFVQGLEFSQIAQAIGLSDLAARKRVERAVDRLRECLIERGVTSESAVMSGAIAGIAQAAPASLLTSVTTSATSSTVAVLANNVLAWTTAKFAAAIALVLAVATTIVASAVALQHEPPSTSPAPVPIVQVAAASTPASRPAAIAAEPIIYKGVITDSAGKPIEGVRVWSELTLPDPKIRNASEANSITDAQGRYELAPLRRSYTPAHNVGWVSRVLRFDHPAYALAWRSIYERDDATAGSTSTASLRLESPAEIQVKVVDGDGKPVTDAGVALFLQHMGQRRSFTEPGYGYLTLPMYPETLKTNGAGIATFARIPASARAHVRVTHPDYVTFDSHDDYSGDENPVRAGGDDPYVVTLRPGGKVRARLVRGNDAIIPRGVQFMAIATDGQKFRQGNVVRAQLDGRAEHLITGLQPGSYSLVLAPETERITNGVWVPIRELTLRAGETTDVTFEFSTGVPDRGRLVDPRTNLPMGGMSISCGWLADANGAFKTPLSLGRTVSNADGTFAVRALQSEIHFEIESWTDSQYQPVRRKVSVPTGQAIDLGDIPVQQPPKVRGRLVDAAGNGIAGTVIVSFERARAATDGSFAVQARFGGGPRDSNRVLYAISDDGELGASLNYKDEWTDPRLALPDAVLPTVTLAPTATVTGEVVNDEDGSPLPDADVQFMLVLDPVRGSSIGYPRPPWGGMERDGHRFAFHSIPVGLPFSVFINHGPKQRTVQLEELRAGEVRDLGTISPTSAAPMPAQREMVGKIAGLVTDVNDKPIAGVRVQCYSEVRSSYRSPEDVTDHAGKFSLTELPVGEQVRLIINHDGYDDTQLSVTVAPDSAPAIKLKPTAHDLIGQPAPELMTAEWVNGKEVWISELTGKVVVLHIGGTLPSWGRQYRELSDVAERFAGKDVQIIAIHRPTSEGDDRNAVNLKEVQEYFKAHPLSIPVATDAPLEREEFFGGQTKAIYQIRNSWPALVVIDKKGVIRGVVKYGQLTEWIERLLAEKD